MFLIFPYILSPQKGKRGSPGGAPPIPPLEDPDLLYRNFHMKFLVLYDRFLAFSWGPGGFRKLREAYRKIFHRSWYLLVPGVTSYSQKPWGGIFF